MIEQFWRDMRGTAVEKYAIGALLATLGAFFIGQSLEQYANNGEFPSLAFLEPGISGAPKSKFAKFNSVDLATTGSIKGQVVILDPCTGQQKN